MAYPASMPVREAVDDFLSRYGFSRDEYAATRYWIEVCGRKLWLPNPRSRRVMVPLHDLHHVATGYDADLRSEAEIGAWELGAGCTTATLWIINTAAALIGLVLVPQRTLRAFHAGRHARSLYKQNVSYPDLLNITVGDLRKRVGVSEKGVR